MLYHYSKYLRSYILVVTMLFFSTILARASVTFAWDPNPEPDVIGYRLHYGTQSGVYSTILDIGNYVSETLTNLQAGNTYYVTVTAYNSVGESGYSNEVSITTPSNPPSGTPEVKLIPLVMLGENGTYSYSIEVHGQPGQSVTLETSDDLVQWIATETFVINEAGIYNYLSSGIKLNRVPRKFYRVVTED